MTDEPLSQHVGGQSFYLILLDVRVPVQVNIYGLGAVAESNMVISGPGWG